MYALHTKKEAAYNDSIWCCDWRQIRHVTEEAEGQMENQETEVEDIVVTGGVDDVVKIWNYKDGELQFKHQLTESMTCLKCPAVLSEHKASRSLLEMRCCRPVAMVSTAGLNHAEGSQR